MENKVYDLIIIGAGPAGLGASIYASRYKLDHLVVGSEIGGQVVDASQIENWAGTESITGRELMNNFRRHAEKFGAKIEQGMVDKIEKKDDIFEVFTEDGRQFQGESLILALGMRPRKLDIPGEDELVGKGVSFCATCDAMFFGNKDVVVIGGGDAAATASLHVAEFANKVYMLYLKDGLFLEPHWLDKIKQNPKIEMICCGKITHILGEQKVEGVAYDDESGQSKKIDAQGVFIEIGSVPGVALAHELGVETDKQDYIKVNDAQETNVPMVYGAGDVTTGSNKFRQIITAVAEGAVASGSVYHKLKLNK
jgi:thioredoxin reductase (NADPH)